MEKVCKEVGFELKSIYLAYELERTEVIVEDDTAILTGGFEFEHSERKNLK